jgi:hypothetical protein
MVNSAKACFWLLHAGLVGVKSIGVSSESMSPPWAWIAELFGKLMVLI